MKMRPGLILISVPGGLPGRPIYTRAVGCFVSWFPYSIVQAHIRRTRNPESEVGALSPATMTAVPATRSSGMVTRSRARRAIVPVMGTRSRAGRITDRDLRSACAATLKTTKKKSNSRSTFFRNQCLFTTCLLLLGVDETSLLLNGCICFMPVNLPVWYLINCCLCNRCLCALFKKHL